MIWSLCVILLDVHICAQISFSVFKHTLDADSLTLRHSMVYSPLYEEESCQASISLCTFYLRLAEQPGWQEEFLFFAQWMKYKVSSYDFYSKSSTWLCKLCSIINAVRIALGIKDWALLLWYPEKVIPACPHRDSGSQFPFFLVSFNHSSFHFGSTDACSSKDLFHADLTNSHYDQQWEQRKRWYEQEKKKQFEHYMMPEQESEQ